MATRNGSNTEPLTATYVVIFFDTDVGVKRLENVIEVESESSAVEQESSMSY